MQCHTRITTKRKIIKQEQSVAKTIISILYNIHWVEILHIVNRSQSKAAICDEGLYCSFLRLLNMV